MREETNQEKIDRLNETIECCPVGCPGADYDEHNGVVCCGNCGWIVN